MLTSPKTCQKKAKFEVLFSMSTAYTQNLGLSSKCKMPYTQSPSRSRFWRHRTRRRLVRNQWEPAGSFKEPMWFHQKSTRKKSLNSKRDIKMNLWLMTNPKIYISWADLGGQTPKEGMLRDAQSFHPSKMESWHRQMVTAVLGGLWLCYPLQGNGSFGNLRQLCYPKQYHN